MYLACGVLCPANTKSTVKKMNIERKKQQGNNTLYLNDKRHKSVELNDKNKNKITLLAYYVICIVHRTVCIHHTIFYNLYKSLMIEKWKINRLKSNKAIFHFKLKINYEVSNSFYLYYLSTCVEKMPSLCLL